MGSGSYVEKHRFDHTNANSMLDNCSMNSENDSHTLNDWSNNLTGAKDWTISGDGPSKR